VDPIAVTFLVLALIVIVTPGQDTALTLRNALLGGRRDGVATAIGVAVGQATWVLATAVGLAAVVVASEPAFVALRVVGAAYLVWLGLRSLVSAWRGASPAGRGHAASTRRRSGSSAASFRQGVVSNLGNPKMAIFFTSLLPQFGQSFASLAGRGVVFVALTLAWLVVLAHVGRVLAPIGRAVAVVTGVVLVALGLRLAADAR
jgi:threonine/homoserine/homoserine lactone efflux protein